MQKSQSWMVLVPYSYTIYEWSYKENNNMLQTNELITVQIRCSVQLNTK